MANMVPVTEGGGGGNDRCDGGGGGVVYETKMHASKAIERARSG